MLTPVESDDVGIMRGDNDDMSGLNGTVGIAFVALYFLLINGLVFDFPFNDCLAPPHLGDQLMGALCAKRVVGAGGDT